MEDKSSLTFTFEGDYEVDAVSIATAIQSLTKVSTEIAKHNYPGVEFRLAVRALAPGSLSFDFVALASVANNLLTPSSVEYANNLINCVKTSFEIKKFLKGNLPRSKKTTENSIIIESTDGSKMTIPAKDGIYFINSSIDQSLTGIFTESSKANGISGVTISHGESKVEIPSKDFPLLSQRVDVGQLNAEDTSLVEQQFTVMRQKEILYIRKPDLLSNAKWEFKSDKYITADVEDLAFLKSVHSGKQSIVAKMYIVADVRVVMELGKDGLPDENTCKYAVVKVHEVRTPNEDQVRLSE